jgi:hypothetical protein
MFVVVAVEVDVSLIATVHSDKKDDVLGHPCAPPAAGLTERRYSTNRSNTERCIHRLVATAWAALRAPDQAYPAI